jgi:hypothetical protein
VGSTTSPVESNTICGSAINTHGWYTCGGAALTGTVLAISKGSATILNAMEILAYSTLPVQHNYFSVEMSSEYPGTSKLNAVGLLISAYGP